MLRRVCQCINREQQQCPETSDVHAVCPFMIYGELVQRWRLAQGAVLRKWPHKSGEPCFAANFLHQTVYLALDANAFPHAFHQ